MERVPEALRATEVTVSYSGNLALDAVNVSVPAGAHVALLGENGAGKSTLLNVLSGIVKPDRGHIEVHGRHVELRSPHDATAAGIFRVHQEPSLIGQLTVAENLVLGLDRNFRNGPVISRRRVLAHAERVLGELGFDYDPSRLVRNYSFGACQLIQLARTVATIDTVEAETPIVLLDEPTAALSGSELVAFERYIELLREKRNASLVFVSHRLSEAVDYCDEFVVLKDGRVVANPPAGTPVSQLHRLMVGRERAADFYAESRQGDQFGPLVVEVDRLSMGQLRDISLGVRRGEVVGVAGLPRSGKHELAAVVAGALHANSGEIRLLGHRAEASMRSRIAAGMGYVPLDRPLEGISQGMSVRDNIANASWPDWSTKGIRHRRAEAERARDLVTRLRVRTRSIAQQAGSLSGGNQQKVVFARWLSRELNLLITDNPTRGVDAGTKEEIYNILRDLVASGVAVLLISDDLPELIGLSNRIFVLRDGRVTAQIDASVDSKPEEHDVVQYMV